MIEMIGGIPIKDGRLLLGLRASHKSYPGCWDVFGGHREAGESLWETLCREFREELGIVVITGAPLKRFQFEDTSVVHVFRVEAWRGEPRIADDEHVELRWFTPRAAQALPNLPLPEYRPLFAALRLS